MFPFVVHFAAGLPAERKQHRDDGMTINKRGNDGAEDVTNVKTNGHNTSQQQKQFTHFVQNFKFFFIFLFFNFFS